MKKYISPSIQSFDLAESILTVASILIGEGYADPSKGMMSRRRNRYAEDDFEDDFEDESYE